MPTVNGNTSASFIKVDSAYAEMNCLRATPVKTAATSKPSSTGSKSGAFTVQAPGRVVAIGVTMGVVGMGIWFA